MAEEKGALSPLNFLKLRFRSVSIGDPRPIGSRIATHLDTFEIRDHANKIYIVEDTPSQLPADVRLASETWEEQILSESANLDRLDSTCR